MGFGMSDKDIDLDRKIKPEIKKLNNGFTCPIMGLGTALINDKEKIQVVYQSIIDGVRLIDTGPPNEEFVGEGIKKALDEHIVKREDLFIVTKLELEEKDNPEEALRKSLDRLKLKYVDLYLDHWPSCININEPDKYKLIPVKETWLKMEHLVDLGLTKSIGVCNYNVENMLNILSIYRIKPVVNEVEFHPYLYQKDLKEFCDKENIILFAYNPLVKGNYCDKDYIYNRNFNLYTEPTIISLYHKYGESKKEDEKPKRLLTKGQIILNWHLCVGVVPIPGTSKPDRMKENLEAKNFTLHNKHIETLCSYEEKQHRFLDGSNIFGINIFA